MSTITEDKWMQKVIEQLETQSIEGINWGLEQIESKNEYNLEEKLALSGALVSIFYHFQHGDTIRTMRVATRIENIMAGFGPDIVPFLFNEIIEADGESAIYLGKTLAKIGKEGSDYLIEHWNEYTGDESALINLTQVLSYYHFSDVEGAIPFIINPDNRKNHRLTSMELFTLGRLIEKSDGAKIDAELIDKIFDHSFIFLSNTKHMLRKNAVRALGKMWRKNLISPAQTKKVHCAFMSITGADGQYNWDDAFIVRSEAEEFLKLYEEAPPSSTIYDQHFRIRAKRLLCPNTFHFVIEAPFIAKKIEAGQFIIVRPHLSSERIPLSICGWDRKEGTVSIVVSAVGRTSTEINQMKEGDEFKDVVGPLGERSRLPETKACSVVIGGGYGIGAIIPTARDLKSLGNKVIGIAGARNSESLILIDELKEVCDEVVLTTNDGSAGTKGMVTDALQEVIQNENVNHVLAVGPVPMMNAVSQMTKPGNIETFVSLNAIMVDGTGMCGACRVSVGDQTKFACIHGPDFNGHQVDFDNLMKRQKMFRNEEMIALETMNSENTSNHE